MANPWYARAFAAVAGSFARASAVKNEFTKVEQGFDALFAAGLVGSITGLTGVPTMVGKALYLWRNNAAENAVEFVPPWLMDPKIIPSGATYTMILSDWGRQLISQDATPVTIYVPNNAAVAAPQGTCVLIHQEGAGQVTIQPVPASGVTIDAAGGLVATRVQFSSASLSVKSLDRWSLVGDLNITLNGASTIGRHALWIPATQMRPSVTGGCAALTGIASAANQPDLVSLDFDTTTQEFAQFSLAMPRSWNEGSISFKAVWSHAAAATFGCVWGLQAVAVSDQDPIAVAFGTQQNVTDAGGVTNTQYVSPESVAITAGGTPLADDTLFFRVMRVPVDAGDTLNVDARLHGIIVYIVTDAGTDA